jgi:hypothetical protein
LLVFAQTFIDCAVGILVTIWTRGLVLSFSEIVSIILFWLLNLCFHFSLSQQVQINLGLNDWNRSRGYRIQILDKSPLGQIDRQLVKTTDHLLSVRQKQVGDCHIHVTRF